MLQRLDWTARPSSLRESFFGRSSAPPPGLPAGETEDMVAQRVAADIEAIIRARASATETAAHTNQPQAGPSQADGLADEAPMPAPLAGAEPAVGWVPDEAVTSEVASTATAAAAAQWVDRARREQRRSRLHQRLAWIVTALLATAAILAAAYVFTGWQPGLAGSVRTLLVTLGA